MKQEKEGYTSPLTIEIPFEEYKELLIIKGKYEELKSLQPIPLKINSRDTDISWADIKKAK